MVKPISTSLEVSSDNLERLLNTSVTGDSSSFVEAVHTSLQTEEAIHETPLNDGRVFIISQHNTLLSGGGIYLGGSRWVRYGNQAAALADAKNLGQGMTYKWAILNRMLAEMASVDNATIEEVNASLIGGGKSVLYDPNFHPDNFSGKDTPLNKLEEGILDEITDILNQPENNYVFAPDMRTFSKHVDYVAVTASEHAACLSHDKGGSGDPSPVTALGVYHAMLETAKYHYNQDDLNNLTIAIQGVGKVGSALVDMIVEHNPSAKFIITDADTEKGKEKAYAKVKELSEKGIAAEYGEANEIYGQSFDIFSPNARGQVLTEDNIKRMVAANPNKGLSIVGSANNQIDESETNSRSTVEKLMLENDILYAPDFVANLGGILNLIYENPVLKKQFNGYQQLIPLSRITGVRGMLSKIYDKATSSAISTQKAAELMAEEHLARWAVFRGYTPDQV